MPQHPPFRVSGPAILLALGGLLIGTRQPARADEIPCPLTQGRWGVIDALPDPLHYPAGDRPAELYRQVSFLVQGKQYVRCSYSRVRPPGEGATLEVELRQPKIVGLPAGQHYCPPAVRIALKDPLPQHWTARTYRLARQLRTEAAGGGEVRCGYWQEGVWPDGRPPFDIERPVRTEYPTLTVPPPPPAPRLPFTNTFAVTGARCDVESPPRPVDCPATLVARCLVTANGSGRVAVKLVHNAHADPVRYLTFDAAGSQALTSSLVAAAPGPGAGPSGTGGLVAPSQANRVGGSVRLMVLAPEAGIDSSDVAPYTVTCKSPTPSGPGSIRQGTSQGPWPSPVGLTHGGGAAPPPPAAGVSVQPAATPSGVSTAPPPARRPGAAIARPAVAASSAHELGGFMGGVRVAGDLEPAGLSALRRPGGSGNFNFWITVDYAEVVGRQPRLPRAALWRAGESEPRAVLFGVELVRSEPAGTPARPDRRRYVVRYQRLELPAPVR